jgi:hypothetical protein
VAAPLAFFRCIASDQRIFSRRLLCIVYGLVLVHLAMSTLERALTEQTLNLTPINNEDGEALLTECLMCGGGEFTRVFPTHLP